MKKWILFFASFAFGVVICFCSYVYLYRAEFTSAALTKMYGTPVKVSKIRVTSTDIELQNVTVYNPSEYTMQPALSVAKISVKITPRDILVALLGYRQVNIRKVSIVDPLIGIEMINKQGTENNWVPLLNNLAASSDRGGAGRTFHIKKLSLNDIAIELKNRSVRKHTKRPPAINRISMGMQDDALPKAVSSILYWVTKQSLEEIGQKLGQAAFTNAISAIPAPQCDPTPFTTK